MKNAKAELMVGVFALVVLAILSFMTFKSGDLSLGKRDGTLVYGYFRNTAGLDEKTRAKIAGVDAGVIEKIELVGDRARLSIRLYPGVVLYTDAKAYIKATGLLGDKYLDLKIGSQDPPLKDGDTILHCYDAADIDELIGKLSNISTDLGGFVAELNDESFKASLRNTMANLEDITDRLKSDTPQVMDDLKSALADLRKVMKNAGPKVESIATKLDSAMDNIQSIARKIDEGEGTIGKLVNDEDLYTSVTGAAKGIEKTLGGINRFRTFINFKSEYMPDFDVTKGYFDITFQPRDDRYYILGIVTNPIGKIENTIAIYNGIVTGYQESEVVKDDIDFTALFGKRWHNTSLRIGLIESTFGLGADQYFFKDRIKLYVDAWDFNADEYLSENMHFKLGADIFATKNLYLTAGYDNFLNDYREGYYVGAGIRFEDEDFKYLFGSASGAISN